MIRIARWLVATPLLLAGCSTLPGASPEESVVARIGDEVITLEQVDATIEQQLYDVRKTALDSLLSQRAVELYAKRLNHPVQALIDAAGRISDQETAAFYEERKADILRSDPEATLEKVAPQIRAVLGRDRQKKFVKNIVDSAPIEILYEQPRLLVSAEGSPSMGPADASVTVVEFSDFQCPYCERAAHVMKGIAERYPKDVRIVYRHFPIPNHTRARQAAEASACADEQGRFWEFHDVIFENPRALSDEDLLRYATELQLDTEKFGECYSSRRFKEKVFADERAGREAGVTGTPGFVVNGRLVRGTSAVEAVIREELRLAAPRPAPPPPPAAPVEDASADEAATES